MAADVAAAGATLEIVLESAALIVCPIAAGVTIGAAVRYATRRRLSGAVAAVACLTVPTIAVAAAVLLYPIIGLWDGATEGFLCGIGVFLALHQMYADPRLVAVSAVSVLAALVLMELGARDRKSTRLNSSHTVISYAVFCLKKKKKQKKL